MAGGKPWFWRIRGTKYFPASAAGWLVLMVCLSGMVCGLLMVWFGWRAQNGILMLAGTGLAAGDLGLLAWACANRSEKHPESRWVD